MKKYIPDVGEHFIAVVRKSEHSRTFTGQEGAGRRHGPFVCESSNVHFVRSDERIFDVLLWDFEVYDREKKGD